jgi:hypothetical protein
MLGAYILTKFESEHKRCAFFFAGSDFPPVIDRKVLQDKTIIDYWYKEPHLMLPHQVNNIISKEQMEGLTHVDVSMGGDHGGGNFRMTFKILFRFHKSPTISWLFQIASVFHSKDDTEILTTMVLRPIGESLRLITKGGRFTIHYYGSCSLTVSFNLNISSY